LEYSNPNIPQHTKVRGELAVQGILIDLRAIVQFLDRLALQQIRVPRGSLFDHELKDLPRGSFDLRGAAPESQRMTIAHLLVSNVHITVIQRVNAKPAAGSEGDWNKLL